MLSVTANKIEKSSYRNCLKAQELNELNKISQSLYNIAILERDRDLEIENFLNYLIKEFKNIEINKILYPEQVESFLEKELIPLSINNTLECKKIILDIKNIAFEFSKIANTTEIELFFAITNKTTCPLFHIDNNFLRLICTYYGKGTLWLENDNINLDKIGCRNNDLIIKDKSKIRKTSSNDIIILKGSRYKNNSTHGVVHKSPEMVSETRVILRIDSVNS